MNIGKLRHRIAIQTATQSRDLAGGPTETWATAATVWGEIVPVTATETTQIDSTLATVTHRVRLRYSSSIAQGARLLFGSRVFNIKQALNTDERDAEWLILAEEVAA